MHACLLSSVICIFKWLQLADFPWPGQIPTFFFPLLCGLGHVGVLGQPAGIAMTCWGYSTVLKGYCQNGDLLKAAWAKLLRSMRVTLWGGFGQCSSKSIKKVDVWLLAVSSSSLCLQHFAARAANYTEALCMFQEMKEHSLRCDELVYNTLMEGSGWDMVR